jgi:L,D-transpeptidase catalytic domain
MSTHKIGLVLAILGGFLSLAKPLPWRVNHPIMLPLQRFSATLFGQNLLAQTSEPSLFPEQQPTLKPAIPVKKPRVTEGSQWGLCGRKQSFNHRSSGFTGDTTGTYIKDIQVNLYSNTYSTVTINWANENSSIETLPIQFNVSPGAGKCDVDCRSIPKSQKNSSHCTPLSPPPYLVQGYSCALTKYPEAKFVTWFHAEREIAFHSYTVPPYPASHGCVRLQTKNHGAEWIYDNTLPGITQIKIDWNPLASGLDRRSESLSPKCWSGERLIDRPTKKIKRS